MAFDYTPGPNRLSKQGKSSSPKPHQRRAAGLYPFYRLAVWCARSFTFKDKPKPHATVQDAIDMAGTLRPGTFRITAVAEHGTTLVKEFRLT